MKHSELHQANRLSWNKATDAHNSHKPTQGEFLASGGSTLFPDELELLGDLQDKRLLHMLCNSGQDTLSLAQHGVSSLVGVDISDSAIATANALAKELQAPAEFIRSDLYDWLEDPTHTDFDIVFSSYGALCWLSDLDLLMKGLQRVLKPGGKVVMIEFHPAFSLFEYEKEDWVLRYPWSSNGEPHCEPNGIRDYVARSEEGLVPSGYAKGVENFRNPHASYEFFWGIGDILTAFLNTGYTLRTFREYPYSNGCRFFEQMIPDPKYPTRFIFPPGTPNIPCHFGLVAEKR